MIEPASRCKNSGQPAAHCRRRLALTSQFSRFGMPSPHAPVRSVPTKPSNCLALRALCCKIAVGAHPWLRQRVLAMHETRKGDNLTCCLAGSIFVRSRISG